MTTPTTASNILNSPSLTGNTPVAAASDSYGSQAIVVIGIVVGFIAVPALASAAPTLVNGLLLLMLVGALLMNSDRWVPFLAQFGNAVSAPTKGG